jgi:hypothetical protein
MVCSNITVKITTGQIYEATTGRIYGATWPNELNLLDSLVPTNIWTYVCPSYIRRPVHRLTDKFIIHSSV